MPGESSGETARWRTKPADAARLMAASVAGEVSHWAGVRFAEAFGILMYHRVMPPVRGLPLPDWNVTPRRFRAQLAGLLARGYQPWALRTVLDRVRDGRPVPRRTFVVTFDDGYRGIYLHAWPILKELGIPATVFLSTRYLDSPLPFPFDCWAVGHLANPLDTGHIGDLPRGRRLPPDAYRPLSTVEAAEMSAGGLVELGAHGHAHADYRGRPEFFRRDLEESLAALRERFGVEEATYAFPYGACDRALIEMARQAGVRCALTTQSELVLPGVDPFHWGRFTATGSDTALSLSGMLSGWYGSIRAAWRPVAAGSPTLRAGCPARPRTRLWRVGLRLACDVLPIGQEGE